MRSQEAEAAQISEDVAVLEIVNSIEKVRPASITGRVLLQGGEQLPTIYRVPKVLRQANEKCYQPQLFSIGPYHHGSKELKPMEEVKFEHLQALLARNTQLKLNDYVREIRALEAQARDCYADKIGLESKEFVGMMVLDGCFLVEMFIRICVTKTQYELWVPYFVFHDMLLLENQLPFCILKRVFCLVAPDQEATVIKKLVLDCFTLIPVMPLNDKADRDDYHHLLDWFHHHCLPRDFISRSKASIKNPLVSDPLPKPYIIQFLETPSSGQPTTTPSSGQPTTTPSGQPTTTPSSGQPTTPSSISSAEELQEAGIQFKRKEWSPGDSFLDIQFHKKGVIHIPYFYFSDDLHSNFQNLIAYEQCYPKAPTFFTGYASFMDDIINTAKDVQILRHGGILEHGLGSDEELAGLFNQMNKGVLVDRENTHLYEVCKAINDFCGTKWHTWRATLMRNYFYNPWAIISLAAALLLLLLTITQTVFSVYPNV